MSAFRLLPIALVMVAGCSDASRSYSDPVPTRGRVVLGGRPVKAARVTFTPADGKGKQVSADTGADGTFVLSTFHPKDGAVPGRYVVTVEPLGRGAAIPARYGEMDQTDFKEMEVKSGQDNTFELALR